MTKLYKCAAMSAWMTLSCTQPVETQPAELPPIDVAASKIVAQTTGHEPGVIEDAYAEALRQATSAWAEQVHEGAAYAQTADPADMEVQQVRARIEQATLNIRLAAQVWAPHQVLKVRDAERVATAQVTAVALEAAEAEPLLLEACKAKLRDTPVNPGEDLDVIVAGPVELIGIEGNRAFYKNRYGQKCEAYATTNSSCREVGVHPRADCTYVDGGSTVVHNTIQCAYHQGEWQCQDGEETTAFPPGAAAAVAAALNRSKPFTATDHKSVATDQID